MEMNTAAQTARRHGMLPLLLVICCLLLSLLPGRAYAAEYTQLTKKTFREVAELIDDEEYRVYYYDGESYTEVGYIPGPNNANWCYIGPKGAVSTSNSYYNGKFSTYYDNNGASALYAASADPDTGSQSFTLKASGFSSPLQVNILNPDGKICRTVVLNEENSYAAELSGLGDGVEYSFSSPDAALESEKDTESVPAAWTAQGCGQVKTNGIYAFLYTDGGTTYLLGSSGNSVIGQALDGQVLSGTPDAAFLWKALSASGGTSYGEWLLQNQGSMGYLAPYNGYATGYSNGAVLQSSDSYYSNVNLHLDDDGSVWNGYAGLNLYAVGGVVKSDESDFTVFTPYAYTPAREATVYTLTAAPEEAPGTLYVRLVGELESMITGQKGDLDAVSSATTGGASYYSGSAATAHMEYALVSEDVRREEVPEESWQRPDYFVNGGEMTVDGTKSRIVISPDGSGMEPSFNYFSGDLALSGTAAQPGIYQVWAEVTDTAGRSDTSNALSFRIYTGSETLSEQLTLANCVQTADGKYMFDQQPWYITDFGGDNTVTVPAQIKAWYGSHGALPTPNYGELGATISLTNGEQPFQTLVIPGGCNLTMVNMRVHSGVKIVVESGARLAIRQTILEGVVEVCDGGSFTMDYNDFGDEAGWLSGSAINGQLRLLDGAILDHARIVSHANYSARDDEERVNSEPIVTVSGTVTLVGDVYILGDEAPTGETGQAGLQVQGTLNVPAGSTLAVYGGGSSFLTADGGDAILLDGGEIVGDGNVIAVGGYGMNITADEGKGHGGAAVSGSGSIAVSRAWLEGGSSYQTPGEPTVGQVDLSGTASYALEKGKQGNETSAQYWHGTGDADGIVPDVEKTLALIPEGGIGVKTEKVSVSVKVQWTDGAQLHENDTVSVTLKDENGKELAAAGVSAADNWEKTLASALPPEAAYTVEAEPIPGCAVEIVEGRAKDAWDYTGQLGGALEGVSYLISYEGEDGKTYILGAQNGALGQGEWNGERPEEIPDGFKWRPSFANDSYGWYLMNEGAEGSYLSMTQSGFDYSPCLRERSGYDYYYALVIDEDGSIWSNQYSQNLQMKNGMLTASGSEYTVFTLHALMEKAEKPFTVSITPAVPEVDFELPAFLTVIEDEAFEGIAATCVEIPKNVTAIGKRAFAGCENLRAIFIPAGVEHIDDTALEDCGEVVVYGAGDEAQRFAEANGFPFVSID